jgi:formylglycine-generating enzyme required for sulfatase activity
MRSRSWCDMFLGALIAILVTAGCNDDKPTSPVNTAPMGCFSVTPASSTTETDFQVDASCSTDQQDAVTALEVRWDWESDGTWDTGFSATKTASHRYASAGPKTIKIEARDTGGLTVEGTRGVTVSEGPPAGMVWIPAGNVRLGQAGIPDAPVEDFYVGGFYIDVYEVSNAEYMAFIAAGGYLDSTYWNPVGWAWKADGSILGPEGWDEDAFHGGGVPGNGQYPVSGVTWWEADAYCRWAGKRLPTEAEWEKAAKGGCETHGDPGQCDDADTLSYPWGEDISGPRANYWASGDPYEFNGWTTPVGYYDGSNHGGYQTIDSPSPYGLYDVAGNVCEWCSTRYVPYPYDPNDGRENPPALTERPGRVLRGGAWSSRDIRFVLCAGRSDLGPSSRNQTVGFRCAKSD